MSEQDTTPGQLFSTPLDCVLRFDLGCDGSALLNSSSNPISTAERTAIPNRTLRDFDQIDAIKEAGVKSCPGVIVFCCITVENACYSESIYVGHFDVRCAHWRPKLPALYDLSTILTILICLASGLHAAVNSGQYPLGGYVLSRPTLM
ncbi:Lipoxygenase, C-terminal [Dillenia turbinata]|uniref:Lipoxygenase, C-terminal n=1 Tax=Dillenia turbinata TaxID=194707 RepID=A0AAN8YYB2_9MAGN